MAIIGIALSGVVAVKFLVKDKNINVARIDPIYTAIDLSEKQNYKSFQDENSEYSLLYPAEFRIMYSPAYTVGFQYAHNALENALITVDLEQIPIGSNAKDYAIQKHTHWLQGEWDGVKLDTTTYKRTIVGSLAYPFKNQNGISGHEIYITAEVDNKRKKETEVWGPFFVLELPLQNGRHAFMAQAFYKPSRELTSVLNIIANSVNVTK